jgi:sugar O-acyltransferase (sialic acid O-acetyltransferase NeuD family)
MRPLVLWGATGQAKVIAEFAPDLGYEIIGLIDCAPEVESPLPGVPIFRDRSGLDSLLSEAGGQELSGAAAIGGWRASDRLDVLAIMRTRGLHTPSLIHPTAWVARDADVANGAQVLAAAAIAARARLGAGVIVNTGARIDHECIVGQGAHVASGAVLAGCVELGRNSFVGPGAVVVARARIGEGSIIGAGAVVTRDIPAGVVAYGSPARVVRPVDSKVQ